jgi:hypothetical protein
MLALAAEGAVKQFAVVVFAAGIFGHASPKSRHQPESNPDTLSRLDLASPSIMPASRAKSIGKYLSNQQIV